MIMTRNIGRVMVLLCAALLAGGCRTASEHLSGSVQGNDYRSAQGEFSAPFPVTAAGGMRILKDGPDFVTFTDNWKSRISVSSVSFAAQSSMTSMLETQGREKALDEFVRRQYGELPAIHFHPETLDGAVSFVYLHPPAPMTAVVAFIHGRRLYLVEYDMAPGMQTLELSDEPSQRKWEAWLENQAVAVAQTMTVK
jgi:hypothetical protein